MEEKCFGFVLGLVFSIVFVFTFCKVDRVFLFPCRHLMIYTQTTLPFQVQVYYTRMDGAKCLRVLSENHTVTTDRKKMDGMQQSAFPILV
jgi:hypothetical protein